MHKELQDNNYLFIDNFISKEKALSLYDQFKNNIHNNPELFYYDPQCPRSLAIYNYKPFLELLVKKIPFMSELMGQTMFPTYCYSRLYKNNEVLEKHKDRNSCEVSVTLHLGSDNTPWDIYFTKPNGDIVSCNLEPGQAVIYLGMVSEHWREEFKGNEYAQVFLHYVMSQGNNWQYYFDKFK